MPQGDRTGPDGMGPMTGRGAGRCRGNDLPGYMSAGGGRIEGPRRMGDGSGSGRHHLRNCFKTTGLPGWMRLHGNAVMSQEDEIQVLKYQADQYTRSLDAVNKRLREINIEKTLHDRPSCIENGAPRLR